MNDSLSLQGELAALATACCWTVTAMSFESAGRRIGSLAVNLLRLLLAVLFLGIFGLLTRGHFLPTDANAHQWIYLALSGWIGFTLGDMALFRAFVLIGSRTSLLIMSLVPLMTALIGWGMLGERLMPAHWAGMGLTIAGVALVVSERRRDANGQIDSISTRGLLLAFVGALGQAGGLVLSKFGMGDFDPFAATQIRVIAGIVGFSVIFLFIGWWPKVIEGAKNKSAMKRVGLGAFFGPFLGVSFSLMAVQHTQAGVAATIMAITPVLIIAPTVVIFKEKVTPRAVLGSVLAVGGVALLFLWR